MEYAEIEPEERNARAEAAVKVGDRIAAEILISQVLSREGSIISQIISCSIRLTVI